MKFVRLLALPLALTLPVVGQTTPPPPPAFVSPATPGSPETAESGSLEVARSGTEVYLTWTLPAGEVRLLEIMRNTSISPQGRDRVASLRNTLLLHLDTVPDPDATYWYWVKITRPDGRIINIGPVATPSATVWTP